MCNVMFNSFIAIHTSLNDRWHSLQSTCCVSLRGRPYKGREKVKVSAGRSNTLRGGTVSKDAFVFLFFVHQILIYKIS